MVSHMIVSLWEEQKQIFFYQKETKSKWVFGQTCTPQRQKNFRFEGNIQRLKKISCPIAKFNMGDQGDLQHLKKFHVQLPNSTWGTKLISNTLREFCQKDLHLKWRQAILKS